MQTFVIYDTEYTTWEGALARQWSGPGEFTELVQIGAMRFDLATLQPLAKLDLMIRPVKCPVLSDYFIKLTGITQAEADAGLPFAMALQQFRDFIGQDEAAAYGDDAAVVRRNQSLHSLPADFHSRDIGPWFMQHGAPYGVKKGVNSGALARTVGAEIDGTIAEHNALEDVRSIIAAYRFLRSKGAPAFFS